MIHPAWQPMHQFQFGPGKTIEHQPKTQRLKPNSHCSWELQITINLLGLVLGLNYQARMICPNHYYNITYSMYILYISLYNVYIMAIVYIP